MSPDAGRDPGRRAWVPCQWCAAHRGCLECTGGRNCSTHWSYLLESDRNRILVECNGCAFRRWHDTGFGRGGVRPVGQRELRGA